MDYFYLLVATDNTQQSKASWTYKSYTIPFSWRAKITGDVYVLNQATVYVKLNGTSVDTRWNSWSSWRITRTTTVDVNAWDTLDITCDSLGSQYTSTYYSSQLEISPARNYPSIIPSEVKGIWQNLISPFFWIIDWQFYVWKEVQSASTWSITPWNFVGYLQIWDYKIPYYK